MDVDKIMWGEVAEWEKEVFRQSFKKKQEKSEKNKER